MSSFSRRLRFTPPGIVANPRDRSKLERASRLSRCNRAGEVMAFARDSLERSRRARRAAMKFSRDISPQLHGASHREPRDERRSDFSPALTQAPTLNAMPLRRRVVHRTRISTRSFLTCRTAVEGWYKPPHCSQRFDSSLADSEHLPERKTCLADTHPTGQLQSPKRAKPSRPHDPRAALVRLSHGRVLLPRGRKDHGGPQ